MQRKNLKFVFSTEAVRVGTNIFGYKCLQGCPAFDYLLVSVKSRVFLGTIHKGQICERIQIKWMSLDKNI